MPSIILKQGQGIPKDVTTLLQEMSDGTHALVEDLGDRPARQLGIVTIQDILTIVGAITVTGGTIAISSIAPGDNNIGNVDIVTVPATELHLGQVGSESVMLGDTPTVTAGIYAAGDCVGGSMEFATAARVAGYGGVIKDLTIIDDAGQDAALQLWLFDRAFTPPGDNVPWVAVEAELHNLVAIISTVDGTWFETGTPSVNVVEVSQQYTCAVTSLFGQLVTGPGSTPTFVATDDITVILGMLQD